MPLQPGSLRQGELSEYPFRGPFGGILSEIPSDYLDKYGFSDANNVIFRQGALESRPGYEALDSLGSEITGLADFWTSKGERVQVVFTDTKVYVWTTEYIQITGTLNPSHLRMSVAVVAGKLCFAHLGTDKVKVWDGITNSFADVSPDAVPAQFLMEFDNRLLALYTLESGTNVSPQRVRYTAPGNPADWTSLAAGQFDLFNDLGPITGAVSLSQRAFIFQQKGLVQLQLTGSGLQPFFISKFSTKGKGCICPYSIDKFGDDMLFYVGSNNVYMFDGGTSNPIGDFPLDGRLRGGARTRIFSDLRGVDLSKVVGHVVTGCRGNIYNAYIIIIPGVSVWVFNIDDYVWTRWTFDRTPTFVGAFFDKKVIRILDLIGPISAQHWTPANLQSNQTPDCIGFGFSDGVVGEFDFAFLSESRWFVQSGDCSLQDFRHQKTEKKFRIIFKDLRPVTLTLVLENDKSEIEGHDIVLDCNNTGKMRGKIFSVNMNGYLIRWNLSGPPGVPVVISEITPVYDTGAELRG